MELSQHLLKPPPLSSRKGSFMVFAQVVCEIEGAAWFLWIFFGALVVCILRHLI